MDINKPIVLYYQIQDFRSQTLELMYNLFNVMTVIDPDHDKPELMSMAHVIFAPMGFRFDKKKINLCANLKVIATPTTGTLHIDTDYALGKNISVCSLKDQQTLLNNITPTAELAWGLILSVTRKIHWAYESVLGGRWNCKEFGERTPKMLSNMTLGVLGLGRLGSLVARYGHAFKMKVYYYDPYVENACYIRCGSIIELAKISDILSIHVHLTPKTDNIVNKKVIDSMPKGSFIINTARGGVLNEKALLDALESEHLGGAGLDILKDEHLPGFKTKLKENPLVQYASTHDNLIITPKIGGCTVDAWALTEHRIIDMILEELEKWKLS